MHFILQRRMEPTFLKGQKKDGMVNMIAFYDKWAAQQRFFWKWRHKSNILDEDNFNPFDKRLYLNQTMPLSPDTINVFSMS